MKPIPVLVSALVTAALVGGGWLAVSASHGTPERSLELTAEPPVGAVRVLEASPFVTDVPWVHEWRAEKPRVSAGYLMVLEVDPELARPRDAYEPVLYVGSQTAERCNAPEEGGLLVVVVPADANADGTVALDPTTVPIWFGSLELPERVDAARIAQELELARRRGLGRTTLVAGAHVGRRADETIRVASRDALQAYVDDRIAAYESSRSDEDGVQPR